MAETIVTIIAVLIIGALCYTIYLMEEEKIQTNKYIRKLEDKLFKCETGR